MLKHSYTVILYHRYYALWWSCDNVGRKVPAMNETKTDLVLCVFGWTKRAALTPLLTIQCDMLVEQRCRIPPMTQRLEALG